MTTLLQSELFILLLILVVYLLAFKLQQKMRIVILNPILVSIIIIISILLVFRIDYDTFHKGSRIVEFFLKPAIVALGVPLYQQLEKIKKQAVLILISQLVGCIVGVVSVVLIAKMFGASKDIIYSLAPKSVTTPIAIEISQSIGGIPSLTASVVVVVGIFGAVFGYTIMKWTKVNNPIAQGLSMGTAAHAVGTSKSMEIGQSFGAMSSIGLIVNGIFTAILTPYILTVLGWWIEF